MKSGTGQPSLNQPLAASGSERIRFGLADGSQRPTDFHLSDLGFFLIVLALCLKREIGE